MNIVVLTGDAPWACSLTEKIDVDDCRIFVEDVNAPSDFSQFADNEPDVLLVDTEGFNRQSERLLQQIKDRYKLVEIIVLYTPDFIDSALKAVRYGVFDFLPKTVSHDVLYLKTYAACQRKTASKQRMEILQAKEKSFEKNIKL